MPIATGWTVNFIMIYLQLLQHLHLHPHRHRTALPAPIAQQPPSPAVQLSSDALAVRKKVVCVGGPQAPIGDIVVSLQSDPTFEVVGWGGGQARCYNDGPLSDEVFRGASYILYVAPEGSVCAGLAEAEGFLSQVRLCMDSVNNNYAAIFVCVCSLGAIGNALCLRPDSFRPDDAHAIVAKYGLAGTLFCGCGGDFRSALLEFELNNPEKGVVVPDGELELARDRLQKQKQLQRQQQLSEQLEWQRQQVRAQKKMSKSNRIKRFFGL